MILSNCASESDQSKSDTRPRTNEEGLQKALLKVCARYTAAQSAHTVQMVGIWLRTRDVDAGILGDVLSSVKLALISGLDV